MFGGWNGEKGQMNDVYIIDLSTMVKCVCVCVSAWACSCLCVCTCLLVCVVMDRLFSMYILRLLSVYVDVYKLYAQIVFSVGTIL